MIKQFPFKFVQVILKHQNSMLPFQSDWFAKHRFYNFRLQGQVVDGLNATIFGDDDDNVYIALSL